MYVGVQQHALLVRAACLIWLPFSLVRPSPYPAWLTECKRGAHLTCRAVLLAAVPTCAVRLRLIPSADQGAALNLNEVKLFSSSGSRLPVSQLSAWMSTQLDNRNDTARFAATNCVDGYDGPGPSGFATCSTYDKVVDPNRVMDVEFFCPGGIAARALSMVEVVNRQDCCQASITQCKLQLVNADQTVTKEYVFDGERPQYIFVMSKCSLAGNLWHDVMPLHQQSCMLRCGSLADLHTQIQIVISRCKQLGAITRLKGGLYHAVWQGGKSAWRDRAGLGALCGPQRPPRPANEAPRTGEVARRPRVRGQLPQSFATKAAMACFRGCVLNARMCA